MAMTQKYRSRLLPERHFFCGPFQMVHVADLRVAKEAKVKDVCFPEVSKRLS